ncbi:MAG: hypothetical protein OXF73_11460 [Gammaproteobacteria bacterium]|nr:hypothetical protein [Gammaproteobacteria bacterium]
MNTYRKRALIIAGAGASLEFGAPSTAELSEFMRKKARTDSIMQHYGGEKTYEYIYEKLSCYLDDRAEPVNFEHIFHCAQEILANFFGPVAGSANEFRPILYQFVKGILASNDKAGMRELVRRIPEFLFSEISAVCDNPKISLVPLEDFPRLLRQDCCTRIYTTNYDDFILQAAPDLYHGFDPSIGKGPRPFKPDTFWDMDNVSSAFHLHGSIHFGFPLPAYPQEDLNALRWFDDRAEARLHYSYSGSQERRMDGSCYLPSALITGFDKLSRMQ